MSCFFSFNNVGRKKYENIESHGGRLNPSMKSGKRRSRVSRTVILYTTVLFSAGIELIFFPLAAVFWL